MAALLPGGLRVPRLIRRCWKRYAPGVAVAAQVEPGTQTPLIEPKRSLCPSCAQPVLKVTLAWGELMADIYEWEPLSSCDHCRWPRAAHPGSHVSCSRCGGTGLIGERRPQVPMLAVDMAWSDESHVRLISPSTSRRKGEALYPIHTCKHLRNGHKSVMVPRRTRKATQEGEHEAEATTASPARSHAA